VEIPLRLPHNKTSNISELEIAIIKHRIRIMTSYLFVLQLFRLLSL
jgi:hypothetical protein